MKLYLLADYKSGRGSWQKGDEIDVDEALAAFLFADAPGCFAVAPPPEELVPKGKPKRAANKAILEAVEEKDAE